MKTILTLVAFLLVINASAQTKYLRDKSQIALLSKKVAALFQENKISESVRELTPYWPLPQNEIESFEEKTIKYLNLYNENYGPTIESVKIKEESIGEIAFRETYLVRFKVTAIRLKFTYYKSNDGWILNSFKWDDSFTEEFK
jgi:hypothetical protein